MESPTIRTRICLHYSSKEFPRNCAWTLFNNWGTWSLSRCSACPDNSFFTIGLDSKWNSLQSRPFGLLFLPSRCHTVSSRRRFRISNVFKVSVIQQFKKKMQSIDKRFLLVKMGTASPRCTSWRNSWSKCTTQWILSSHWKFVHPSTASDLMSKFQRKLDVFFRFRYCYYDKRNHINIKPTYSHLIVTPCMGRNGSVI